MPAFVELPGDVVGAPPYLARDCLLQSLFLEGDLAAQQAFCDLALNRPSGGALQFRALTNRVLVTAIYCASLGSTDPVDAAKGVVQEWDVGFWTLVHGGRAGDEDNWASYWLPSFLFVDTPAAMASGREIYGYPKTTAAFSGRAADDDDPSVVLTVMHFPVFGPDQRPVTEPLVRITPGAPAAGPAPNLMDNLRAAWALITGLVNPDPPAHQGFHLPPLPHLSMPQIMLRQARDPAVPGLADLQRVLTVAPALKNVTRVGPLRTPVTVDLTASASHPIMATLGLAPSQGAELGFYVRQDFEVGPATLLD